MLVQSGILDGMRIGKSRTDEGGIKTARGRSRLTLRTG